LQSYTETWNALAVAQVFHYPCLDTRHSGEQQNDPALNSEIAVHNSEAERSCAVAFDPGVNNYHRHCLLAYLELERKAIPSGREDQELAGVSNWHRHRLPAYRELESERKAIPSGKEDQERAGVNNCHRHCLPACLELERRAIQRGKEDQNDHRCGQDSAFDPWAWVSEEPWAFGVVENLVHNPDWVMIHVCVPWEAELGMKVMSSLAVFPPSFLPGRFSFDSREAVKREKVSDFSPFLAGLECSRC
jgi:hypothetical protein